MLPRTPPKTISQPDNSIDKKSDIYNEAFPTRDNLQNQRNCLQNLPVRRFFLQKSTHPFTFAPYLK